MNNRKLRPMLERPMLERPSGFL